MTVDQNDMQKDLTLDAIRKVLAEEQHAAQRTIKRQVAAQTAQEAQVASRFTKLAPADGRFKRWTTKRNLALFGLGAVVLIRPWLLPGLALGLVLLLGGLWAMLGSDRLVDWFERYERRNPARALVLRQRAQRLSDRLDAVLDRLPERWTRGLYMPDFEASRAAAETTQQDPFDRLATE